MRLNAGMEDEMEMTGYRLQRVHNIVTWCLIVMTAGLLRLVFYWKPEWMLYCTHKECDITSADAVLLKDQYNQSFVEQIKKPKKRSRTEDTPMQAYPELPVPNDLSSPLLRNYSSGTVNTQASYFINKKIKYLWNEDGNSFKKLHGLENGLKCSEFHNLPSLTETESQIRRELYGENRIEVHVTPVLVLLFTQVLNPFYVFQLFSVIVWFNDQYHYYASCIIIVSAFSIILTIYQTRKMQRALKSTVSSACMVSVCRDNNYLEISSEDLAPGDVFEVPRLGCDMQCDAVLLEGNCIVNESMLTGESVPVTKTPLPNPKYRDSTDKKFSIKEHSRHVLFCGTHVIQTRYYGKQRVKAVVLRTGFQTSKGDLVRSILFPKPVDFKFTQDALKFIMVMCTLAMVGMIYTVVIMIDRKRGINVIILRTLDMVTVVIPPALPAAMTVGIVFAQTRLKKALVYCISPRSINLCGAINAVCFDKTGTLTEEGLDTWGVVPVTNAQTETPLRDPSKLSPTSDLLCCMATCHSLTVIDSKLSGDTLDLKMFESTSWEFNEPGCDTTKFEDITPVTVKPRTPDIINSSTGDNTMNVPYEIGIIRQFTFSSSLQRMSVITRRLGSKECTLYCKGSPEMIATLCVPESMPVDFHTTLMEYTQQGYRVIALACKPNLKLKYHKLIRVQREQVECNLIFLGLLVMENRLKEQSTRTIDQLKNANIRTVMVTGDNMLTALSVSRDCHMIEKDETVVLVHAKEPVGGNEDGVILRPDSVSNRRGLTEGPLQIEWLMDEYQPISNVKIKTDSVNIPLDKYHFLMTGKTWAIIKKYEPELLPKIVVRGTVFARMSPEQKAQLIEILQEVGYYVGMCGDGANDCGALRCAHAGISLSEAEASVASSFTSKTNDISCVPTVIREGRAALVTSFGIFKYMACYSLTQFVTVCILYWIAANLTDFTYLYIDMILLTSLSITFGYTGAYHTLSNRTPSVSLLSVAPLLSIFVQMAIITSVQVFVWFLLKEQSWYEKFEPNDEEYYWSYEVTALFSISSFQYIILGFIFSHGAPYRKPIYTNVPFMINWICLTLLTIYIVLDPFKWLEDLLELRLADEYWFRAAYIGIAGVNFILCLAAEYVINDIAWLQKKFHQLRVKIFGRRPGSEYERIENELQRNCDVWPPVSASTMSISDVLRVESTNSNPTPEPKEDNKCDLSFNSYQTDTLTDVSDSSRMNGGNIAIYDSTPL